MVIPLVVESSSWAKDPNSLGTRLHPHQLDGDKTCVFATYLVSVRISLSNREVHYV
jgi:hypothetical protein